MKKSSILIFSLVLLTSCSFGNSSLNGSNQISSSITNEKSSIVASSNEFVINNLDVKLSTSGSVSFTEDGAQLGSRAFNGTLSIRFNSPIVVDALVFTFPSTSASFEQTITYNDNESFVLNVKPGEIIHRFDEPVLLNSISILGTNKNNFVFKAISFNKCEPIKVASINKLTDLEVEINRYISIESSYEVLPNNATFKDVTLSSNDEFVLINDNKVKVTTVGDHIVRVTANSDTTKYVDITLKCSQEAKESGYKTLSKARFTYDDLYKHNQIDGVTPSKGNVKVFVVPVNFSDLTSVYNFNDKTSLDRLNAVFNGTNEDNSNDYFESLKSFYYKSSYGQLNFDFVLTDVYTPSYNSSYFKSKSDNYGSEAKYLINDFYDNATINSEKINFNDPIYDSNNDGLVDGVWFIYNDNRESTSSDYWPYTYWYTNGDTSINKKNINISAFANCSVYFTYEGNRQGLDGHTLFHETGHMLGLEDYYITSNVSYMSALGGLDMMDYNIGDHNAFSKYSLGLVNPFVVEDNAYINLKPFSTSGEFVIVPTSSFNDSAFGEYILIEYYTPTNLNKFDAEHQYVNRSKYFTQNGIRMFHIDARLANVLYNSNGYMSNMTYIDSSATVLPTVSTFTQIEVTGSNTPSYSLNDNHLIEAITRNNVSTYRGKETSNASLFIEGDIMDPAKYTSFFTNSKMHDGSTMNYSIEIVYMDDDVCTLSITK